MTARWFRYFASLALLILVLISVNYFLAQVIFEEAFSKAYYVMHLYYIVLVIFSQMLLVKSLKERPQRFVINFMAVMGIKMFLSLAVLVLVVYTGLMNSKFFIVNYLILYLAYSAFSVAQILSFQKVIPPKENP